MRPRRILLFLLLLSAASAAIAGPRIVNGVFTSEYPSTGALLFGTSAGNASLICSGTLIGCHTFLTAAHCVCDTVGGECQPGGPAAPDTSRFWVFLQHAGVFAVTNIRVRSDYDFPRADVAVLRLAADVSGVRPTPLDRTRSPSVGMPGTIVGFGSSGGVDYGLKRAGRINSAPCTPPDPVNATLTCWNFEAPVGPPGTDSDTCFGDSGGPLFVDFGCGPTVAGVTSGGSASSCEPTDHSFDADVFTYHDYLDATGGSDVQARACGAAPQAGEPGAPITGRDGELDAATPEATQAFTVPSGTTRLRVALNAIDDGLANFDFFLRFGSPPTSSLFDCAGQGSGQFAVCDLPAPAAGTWYALVRRVTGEGIYQLTATTFAAGAPAPANDGQTCDDGNTCTGPDACDGGNCFGDDVPDGSPCDDGRGCTQADACRAGVCQGTDAPAPGCRGPLAGKTSLLLKDRGTEARRQLTWKWRSGSGTTATDLGDPTADTPYEFCVFDTRRDAPRLVVDTQVPPGPAWSPSGHGFRYRDQTGAVAGMSRITLQVGSNGSASFAVKAKGPALTLPVLPLQADPTVLVQLLNGNACWEARYESSVVNEATEFKARTE